MSDAPGQDYRDFFAPRPVVSPVGDETPESPFNVEVSGLAHAEPEAAQRVGQPEDVVAGFPDRELEDFEDDALAEDLADDQAPDDAGYGAEPEGAAVASAPAGIPALPDARNGTGDPRVDDALARLDDLAALPLDEHIAVFDEVSRRLHDALASLDS